MCLPRRAGGPKPGGSKSPDLADPTPPVLGANSKTSQDPMCLAQCSPEVGLRVALQLQTNQPENRALIPLSPPEPPRSKLARARIASTADSRAGRARTCRAPITGLRAGAQALRPWAWPHRPPISAGLPASSPPDWPRGDDVCGRLGLWRRSRPAGGAWRKWCGRGVPQCGEAARGRVLGPRAELRPLLSVPPGAGKMTRFALTVVRQ